MSEYDVEAEEQVVKKRQTKVQMRREQEMEDIRNFLKFPGNRAFLWRVLEYCGVFNRISSLDDIAMRLAAARRDVALWIKDELNEADANAFINLMREAQQREKND